MRTPDDASQKSGPRSRIISFYLPQFHQVPENDVFWGEGFTEWSHVVRGKPLFPGHYQPRIPADLGFYDLRLPEVRQAQADLARDHGIHGFSYYHYWFEGRRVLERPFQEVLESGEPDFPFCLCWANHDWRWRRSSNGRARLIAQRLLSSQLKDSNAKLADFLERLRFSPFISRYIEGVERARLEIQIRQQEERVNHRRRLEEESQTLRETRQELTQAHHDLKETRQELRGERQRLNEATREIAKLAGWIEELGEGISALLGSRQWKTGHALGELRRKALRRPEEPTAVDRLEAVLGRFRAWREDQNSRFIDPPTDDEGDVGAG